MTVVFDMDGTLVDNSYLHTLAWWYACREHDVPMTMASIHRLIGMGGDQMVPAMVGHEMPALEQSHARRYRSVLADVTVLPGAAELIGELHRRRVTIALASSSSRADLDVLLARITTGSLIDHVVSKDDVAASKPAPDLVVVALKASGAEPDEALFIGDTGWDVEAAARAGVPCIGVRTGGWAEQELRDAGAVAVYADAAALLSGLDDSMVGAYMRRVGT